MKKKESSFVIAEDSRSRILAIWETKKGKNQVGPPGGTVEKVRDGKDPLNAALREFSEEVPGVQIVLGERPRAVIETDLIRRIIYGTLDVSGKLPENANWFTMREFERLDEDGLLRPWVLGAMRAYRDLEPTVVGVDSELTVGDILRIPQNADALEMDVSDFGLATPANAKLGLVATESQFVLADR